MARYRAERIKREYEEHLRREEEREREREERKEAARERQRLARLKPVLPSEKAAKKREREEEDKKYVELYAPYYAELRAIQAASKVPIYCDGCLVNGRRKSCPLYGGCSTHANSKLDQTLNGLKEKTKSMGKIHAALRTEDRFINQHGDKLEKAVLGARELLEERSDKLKWIGKLTSMADEVAAAEAERDTEQDARWAAGDYEAEELVGRGGYESQDGDDDEIPLRPHKSPRRGSRIGDSDDEMDARMANEVAAEEAEAAAEAEAQAAIEAEDALADYSGGYYSPGGGSSAGSELGSVDQHFQTLVVDNMPRVD
jgi:hypothetical protein